MGCVRFCSRSLDGTGSGTKVIRRFLLLYFESIFLYFESILL